MLTAHSSKLTAYSSKLKAHGSQLTAHSSRLPYIMLTIQLQDLEFFAYHGLYESEKLHGNNFLVNAFISIDANEKIEQIDQTVDYVKVYGVIKSRMQIATPLLETIAQELVSSIYAADNRIKSIEISIKKLTPPIPDFKGTVGVSIKQLF